MRPALKVAAAGLLAATATLAFAHDGEHEEHRTVIIKEVHGGGAHADAMAHDGMAKCSGNPDVDVTDEKKDDSGEVKRSRVLICSGGAQGADIVKHLEDARARIAKQSELSAETQAKVLAALDAAIARHKGATK